MHEVNTCPTLVCIQPPKYLDYTMVCEIKKVRTPSHIAFWQF